MSAAAAESYNLLQEFAAREYRGRGDTWGAAVGRVATKAKIPHSYAERLWFRWQNMKKADGDVLLALQHLKARYEASCEYHENRAEELRTKREARHAMGSSGALAPVGGDMGTHRPDQGQTR